MDGGVWWGNTYTVSHVVCCQPKDYDRSIRNVKFCKASFDRVFGEEEEVQR